MDKSFKALEPYRLEPYFIVYVNDCKKRRLLARFRIRMPGVAPLRVERGRYEANGRQDRSRGVPYEDRKCMHCDMNVVEDELHFFMVCPKYVKLREV